MRHALFLTVILVLLACLLFAGFTVRDSLELNP